MLGAQQPVAQRGIAPKLVAQQLLHQRPLAALPVGGEGELAAELVRLLWRARLAYGLGGGIVAARLLRLEAPLLRGAPSRAGRGRRRGAAGGGLAGGATAGGATQRLF